jgi:putative membrane protein
LLVAVRARVSGLAAHVLGLDEVPCIVLAHLTPAQRRAYVLADNKLALNAGWDLEMLSLEIGELGEAGFDLSLTGFDEFELDELFAERTQGRTARRRAHLCRLGPHWADVTGSRGGAKKTLSGVLPEWVVVLTGSVLVAFAAFCFAAAVWRELYPGTPPPRPDVRRLPRALLFALNGFLALVALAALLGVCFGRTGGS